MRLHVFVEAEEPSGVDAPSAVHSSPVITISRAAPWKTMALVDDAGLT